MKKLSTFVLLGLAACGGSLQRPGTDPDQAGSWMALNRGAVHLGDRNYTGQSFDQAQVSSNAWCALVRLPRAAACTLRIVGLRNTEQPTNQLRVDGESAMLPMMLSQTAGGGSLGASMSTSWDVALEAGPHEFCVVAGRNLNNPFDVDDFEFSALLFRADDLRPADIEARPLAPSRGDNGGTETGQRTSWGGN